jgi:hypothetical protein
VKACAAAVSCGERRSCGASAWFLTGDQENMELSKMENGWKMDGKWMEMDENG